MRGRERTQLGQMFGPFLVAGGHAGGAPPPTAEETFLNEAIDDALGNWGTATIGGAAVPAKHEVDDPTLEVEGVAITVTVGRHRVAAHSIARGTVITSVTDINGVAFGPYLVRAIAFDNSIAILRCEKTS